MTNCRALDECILCLYPELWNTIYFEGSEYVLISAVETKKKEKRKGPRFSYYPESKIFRIF